MEIIINRMHCLSLTGMPARQFGYSIQQQKKRFFAKRNSTGFVPKDGHLRMIYLCAEMAQTGFYVTNIRLPVKEYREALDEAGYCVSVLFDGVNGNLNAKQIRTYKSLFRHYE